MIIETLGRYGLLKSVNILEAPKREEDGQAAHLHVNNEAGFEKFAKDRIAECLRNTDAQIAEQLPITHIGFLIEEEENIYSILEE